MTMPYDAVLIYFDFTVGIHLLIVYSMRAKSTDNSMLSWQI